MPSKRTVDQIIGDRIRVARHMRGMTMDQLGKAVDIRYNTIHKIEMGLCKMSVERLFKIAKALNTPVEKMLRGF